MATRPISNVINVWNQNTTYTGIGLNITDTLSGTDSKLLNLQINSSSKFYVDKSGNVVATGNVSSNKFTASYARIGSAPITSQYTFEDNSTPNLYSNKIRAYSASFTYLEIISGSAPNSKTPVITDLEKIIANPDQNLWIQGPGEVGGGELINQGIFFSGTGNYVSITCRNDLSPSDGTVAVLSPNISLGTSNTGKSPIEIENGAISFNPKNPNDCTDFNGCLNISGNFFVKGIKVGPNSLYLSSSLTESSIHGTNLSISSSLISASRMYVSNIRGTNLSISSSLISASRMYVGGKTKTSQYKFYDGSKPDLYVNKFRAYSGSFTSLEIITGSEGSMSIKDKNGKNVFQSGTANGGYIKMGEDFLDFLSDNKSVIFGGAGKGGNAPRSSLTFNGTDIVSNTSCSISGAFFVKGDTMWSLGAITGSATGTIRLSGSNLMRINNVTMSFDRIKGNYKDLKISVTSSVYNISGGSTNLIGTHSMVLSNGALTIDGTNAPPIKISKKGSENVARMLVEMSSNIIKFGTQSLWITGSTISGSELNIYAPDFNSKINVYHITGSSGKFDSFNVGAITASALITASSAGASSGKYAKIKIGNETYKILLYADS